MIGYEQLLRMSSDELLTLQKRETEKLNRRISRLKQTDLGEIISDIPRPKTLRSAKAQNAFLAQSHDDMVAEVWRTQSMETDIQGVAQLRSNVKQDLATLVGVSYTGREHDEAYRSNWVADLTDKQIAEFSKRLKALETGGESAREVWYRIQEQTVDGSQIEPIRSYDDLIGSLSRVEAGMEDERRRREYLDSLSPDERTREIQRKIGGRINV